MAVPPQIVEWANRTYPRPRMDMEWLEACYDWLVDQEPTLDPVADFNRITNNVDIQFLGSSLADSTVPGTGLPANANEFSGTLSFNGQPLLVEIVSITDVGQSAFSLLNTRQTRIDRADLAGMALEQGDAEAAEDEGPIPKYPRSMLKLEVTDGTITMRAMEYRRISELELGATPLGYKIQLINPTVTNGILFLEPDCVVMKGGKTDDLEERQDELFLQSLHDRLGISREQRDESNGPAPVYTAPVIAARGPVALPARPVNPLPARAAQQAREQSVPRSMRSPLRQLSTSPSPVPETLNDDRPRRIPSGSGPPNQSPYFASGASTSARAATDTLATMNRLRVVSPRPGAPAAPPIIDEYDFDSSIDDAEIAALEEAERRHGGISAPPPSTLGSTYRVTASQAQNDVIEIDDDEDDKENVPAPRPDRRVRLRQQLETDIVDLTI